MDKTENFIEKARKVHQNRYDYSMVEFKNNHTKVSIICSIHNVFEQLPDCHLRGSGCSKCAGTMSMSNEEFIKKAQEVHQNKYNYSMVKYKSARIKVSIICPIHNIFKQKPHSHLHGQGCPKCVKRGQTREEFIEKAIKIHKDKYKYDLVKYKNNSTKVSIICPIHSVFQQRPNDHLSGKGCRTCGGNSKKTKEEFIENSNKIHKGKFDYSQVEYENNHTKVSIICPIHDLFEQIPKDHLNGSECPKCVKNNYSKKQITWLNYISSKDNIHIQHAENEGEFKVGKYKIDGYCKETNTCYEFHGSLYHGNPRIYKADDIHPLSKEKMGDLYKKTLEKENYIKSQGYNLIVMWEDEWNKLYKNIEKTLSIN